MTKPLLSESHSELYKEIMESVKSKKCEFVQPKIRYRSDKPQSDLIIGLNPSSDNLTTLIVSKNRNLK